MGTVKRLYIGITFLALIVFQSVPVHAISDPVARVLINEIQTESLTDANQEFVELVNISTDTIDLSGWMLQYRAATGTSWADKAILSGQLYPGGSILVATQTYLSDNASFFWTQAGGVLASSGGNLRLMPANSIAAEDTVAWGAAIYGEGIAALKPSKGSAIQRKVTDLQVQDTNDNSQDFEVLDPSPLSHNVVPVEIPVDDDTPPAEQVDPTGTENPPVDDVIEQPAEDPIATDDTTAPDVPEHTTIDPVLDNSDTTTGTDTPELAGSNGTPQQPIDNLLPIVINELMVDPASPQTDADDEWIELYNPNNAPVSLMGYRIQTGGTFSHSYTLTDQAIPAGGYLVLYSGLSNISLSNSGGATRILNTGGEVVGLVVSYEESETGSSYALDTSGVWVWTTTPTPAGENVFTAPADLMPTLTTKTTPIKTPKKATPKTSTTKVTAVKSASTSSAKKTSTVKPAKTSTSSTTVTPSTQTPSHPTALAGFGLLAVGYALYEYREDFANKLRIIRRYLEVRRSRGTSL